MLSNCRSKKEWKRNGNYNCSLNKKNRKITSANSEGKSREFQKQILELTSRGSPTENEFSFSQNTIWSAIENFSYSPEEDVTFMSYFKRYEDLYTTDCSNWSDSKKVLLRKLGTTEHIKFIAPEG